MTFGHWRVVAMQENRRLLQGRSFSHAPAIARWPSLSLLVVAFLLPDIGHAAESFVDRFRDQFIDPVDGQFDTGLHLESRSGFLPVPIVISEPAVGYGGGAAILYFHRRTEEEQPHESEPSLRKPPPTVTGVAAAGTENATWAVGAGHSASWKQDRIRFTGGGGYANVNLAFYRQDIQLDMNGKGYTIDAKIEHRLWGSNFFLGAGYRYVDLDVTLKSGPGGLLPLSLDSQIGGIDLTAHYDSRDNVFNPNTGQDLRLEGSFFSPGLGGDSTWQQLGYNAHSYHQLHERVVVMLRFDGNLTWNDAPFYALPYVQLRGIPSMRYQGEMAGEGEIDFRVRVWKRWHAVGFIGAGWIAGDTLSTSGDSGPFWAGGGGIRYLLARRLGLQVGVDVARGPEQTAFYLQIGSPW